MNYFSKYQWAVALAIALHAPTALSAGTVFWFPINNGSTLQFLTSGNWIDSFGNAGSYGPDRQEVRFSSADSQTLDSRATLAGTDGMYLAETPNGYYRVSDGNPTGNENYTYYIDPRPFITKDVRELGQEVHLSGLWRGQRQLQAGVYPAFTGSWDSTFTNLGSESVTTPLGTFQATKLKNAEIDTYVFSPLSVARGTWTEYMWFVENLGIVKTYGSGIFETDINGDGVVDHWKSEDMTMIATSVPEPNSLWLLGSGIIALLGLSRTGSRVHSAAFYGATP